MRHSKSTLLALSLAFAAFATAATSSASGDADDVVILKNGGRLRGTVVSEEPTAGVRIKLPTGAVRVVKTEEVAEVRYASTAPGHAEAPVGPPLAASAAPPTAKVHGKIHVDTSAPGTVQLDGALVGPAPADVDFLAVGRHRVRVNFDEGGSKEESVLIQADRTFPVHLDPPVVRPLQIEALGFAAYGLLPSGASGDTNPFAMGVGVRGGVLVSRVYLGIEYAHYFGQSNTTVSGSQTETLSGSADVVSAQAGYDIHLGASPVVLRPYLGLGPAVVHASYVASNTNNALSDSDGETVVFASTGLYGRVMLSKLLFAAADARFNLAVNEHSARQGSFFIGAGALFL